MKKVQIELKKQLLLKELQDFMDFCDEKIHPLTQRRINSAVTAYVDFMDSQDELSEEVADLLARGVKQLCQDELVNIGSSFWKGE